MRIVYALVIAIAIAAAGCKQGQGDRCQVDADCQDGLVCNQAKNTCESSSSAGGIDANVPDGPRTDAGMVDAPPDAKVFMDAAVGVAP